jgi:hypothetical protein
MEAGGQLSAGKIEAPRQLRNLGQGRAEAIQAGIWR